MHQLRRTKEKAITPRAESLFSLQLGNIMSGYLRVFKFMNVLFADPFGALPCMQSRLFKRLNVVSYQYGSAPAVLVCVCNIMCAADNGNIASLFVPALLFGS